jgi:signal transduction histidine kinase
LEGDKIEINKERVNIKEEIQMYIHGNETDALSKGIELKSNVDTGVPDVYADKARTVEVLNNLISNGIKYTEQGSVTIVTEYDDKYVKIIVEDTGKGISEEEIPKLGHKFHRIGNYIQSSENREIVRPGGTGLGLYVSFNLVALMGGKMWVESELGKGSKFIFTLPVFKNQIESDSNNTSNNMFERLGLKK